LRLDIDARFVPFAVIIWINSVLIITKHLEVAIFLLLLLIILTFVTRINYLYSLAAIVTIISSFAHISKEKIIELTPGVPVVAYVKVISDVENNAGRNVGIFRQEDTFSVVSKSFRIEETGLKQNKGFIYKSRIKLDFSEINNDIEFGTKLKVKGHLKSYDFQNITYSLKVEDFQIVRKPNLLDKSLNTIRSNFLNISSKTRGDAIELLPGLILGDTRNQSQSLNQDMKNSGLTHLTAVSGGNIAILLLAIIWLSQKLNFNLRKQIIIGLITLILFALLVRTEPSVVRASFMGAVALFGLFKGTRKHGLSALAITICVALLIDPNLSTSWGFSLSVFATAGLLLFTRPFADQITRAIPRIPEALAVLIAVALSAQISTAGLIAGFSGQITLWSIPANVLVAPVIPFVTILGYLALLFSNIFFPLGLLFGLLASYFANWIGFIARLFASFNSSLIQVPKGLVGFILVTTLTVIVCLVVILIFRFKLIDSKSFGILFLIIFLLLFVWGNYRAKSWPMKDWQFVMCDVGQGDGLVLKDSTGKVLVVDVGPNGKLMNDCLKSLKVKSIDALILTHFHADHVQGLELVRNRHEIKKIYVTWVEDPIYEVKRIRELLQDFKTIQMKAGDSIKLGEMVIQSLWPTDNKIEIDSIPNNSSIVNLVTIKNASFLLTGDIEPPAQEMIRNLWKIPQVDVVKIPHHGSRFQDSKFVQWTRARLALVSVGKENSYGHPAKSALDLYRDSGMQVLSTDEVGSIAIKIGPLDSIQVSTKE
jgi:competence protein ComEC